MTDSDDTLLDKIRRDVAAIQADPTLRPKYILPIRIDFNDVDGLCAVAAGRFSVDEDDVTAAMIFAIHVERLLAG